MSWRAFVGDWDWDGDGFNDWVSFDQTVADRADAVDLLLGRLALFEADECTTCRLDAAEETVSLKSSSGEHWAGTVEGDDYVLQEVQ